MDFTLIDDTIVAIATAVAPSEGSIAIIRVSGPKAESIGRRLFLFSGVQTWESHRVLYGYIVNPINGERIDEALLLIMKAPRSFTAEDVIEFQCHGGLVCVQRVLELVISEGARRALPGEFTQRAVLHGRLDITRAEAISELIGARSRRASQLAMVGLGGGVQKSILGFRERLLDQLAEIEARVDFEENILPVDECAIKREVQSIVQELIQLVVDGRCSAIVQRGLRIALVGRPNVGKSSLLNRLSRRERAIVTDIPGTTRDLIETEIILNGVPITLLDTAGIQVTEDKVEKVGIERSREAIASADAIVLVFDLVEGWTLADAILLKEIPSDVTLLIVGNKADRYSNKSHSPIQLSDPLWAMPVSAMTGEGEASMLTELLNRCGAGEIQEINLALNARQCDLASSAASILEQGLQTFEDGLPIDFFTIDLRQAIKFLGQITGDDISESTLDRIFSRFCIGK